jgi:hypothetical protein
MDAILKISKNLMVVTLLSTIFVAGCNRNKSSETPPAAESPTTGGSAGTTGTTTPPGTSGMTTPRTTGSTTSDSSGASGTTGSTMGTAVDDATITTKVKTALLAHPDIKGLNISVETHNGEVILSGVVDNQAQMDNAVKIAQSVDGVKKVTNKLTVKQ